MKAALILTGHLRCWQDGYKTFKRYILDKMETDVYISTWDEVGYYTGRGYKKTRSDGFINLDESDEGFVRNIPVNFSEVIDAYKPKVLDIEHFPDVEDDIAKRVQGFCNAYTRPKNTAAQFYKISRGISLAYKQMGKDVFNYDYVIRTRPDLVIQDNLHFPEWYNKDTFYYNPGTNPKGIGYGDQLHIGSAYHMQWVANVYYIMDQLYNRLGYSCPHAFLSEIMGAAPLKREQIRVPTMIMHTPAGPYKEWDTGQEHKPTE